MSAILLVDDDSETLDSTAQFLRGHGYEVLKAKNGPAAISCIISQQPQLVCLDLGLPSPDPEKCPVFDGYKVLDWINRMQAEKRIPVVLLTATAASVGKARALELGACAYLEKPIATEKLLTTIQIALDEI
jgi:CheY-like chemotaxis protein